MAPEAGALNHTSSDPLIGAGVGVEPVGVGVGDGVGLGVGEGVGLGVGAAAFCTFTLITSFREFPAASYAVAVSVCVPLANFVVSMRHCVPSAGVVSVLSAVESILNATRATLPEVFV